MAPTGLGGPVGPIAGGQRKGAGRKHRDQNTASWPELPAPLRARPNRYTLGCMRSWHTPPWTAVTIEHEGKTYRGSYFLERGRVTVWYGPHRKIAQLDGSNKGMSEETMEHAFQPFFTTKSLSEGAGLGLSMLHGFAKQSGGGVSLASRLGAGTEVAVYLPLLRDRASGESTILLSQPPSPP